MTNYKENFVVLSKTKKENEKEDETTKTYSAFLRSEIGNTMNLHSDKPIVLNVKDELELKLVKHQSTLVDKDKDEEEE